ncbi:hypothetical protein Ddc_12741 [Ditylenchus destructor]|nr:hypothetical protein Ddc_12741 [Ditylenchus destructor]
MMSQVHAGGGGFEDCCQQMDDQDRLAGHHRAGLISHTLQPSPPPLTHASGFCSLTHIKREKELKTYSMAKIQEFPSLCHLIKPADETYEEDAYDVPRGNHLGPRPPNPF